LPTLKWLRERGCVWDASTLTAAAHTAYELGDTAVLEYVLDDDDAPDWKYSLTLGINDWFRGYVERRRRAQLLIVDLQGHTTTLDAERSYVVGLVLEEYGAKTGVDTRGMRLVHHGLQLDEHKTLFECEIKGGDQLHLLSRPNRKRGR